MISLRKIFSISIFLTALALVSCSGVGEGGATEGIQMPESPLLRLFERKSGRILYLGLDGNLYTINQAGEDAIPVTMDANPDASSSDYRGYMHFAWAPNNEKIAFVGYDREKVSLFTSDINGGNPVTAFSAEGDVPIFLYWTPNSNNVGILASKLASNELSVHLASADGQSEAKMIGDGQPYFWAWGPNGASQFLAHVGAGETSKLVMVSSEADKTFEWNLTPAMFQAPAWSPDGSQIMVSVVEDSAKNSLVVTDLQGRIQQTIASFEDAVAFDWSPDGKKIAYLMSQYSRGALLGKLVVQDPSYPENEIEVDHPFVHAYFWAPDSKKLAYFTLEVAPGDPQSEESNFVAMGLYILDVKSGKSKNLLYFIPTERFDSIITYFDQYKKASTLWSPDSENVVISAVSADGESARIIVVPASGNLPPREIADGILAFWSWK